MTMTLKDLNDLARKAKAHPEHVTILVGGAFLPSVGIKAAEIVDDFYMVLYTEEEYYIEVDDA